MTTTKPDTTGVLTVSGKLKGAQEVEMATGTLLRISGGCYLYTRGNLSYVWGDLCAADARAAATRDADGPSTQSPPPCRPDGEEAR